MNKGGRNLIILGVAATIITLLTTSISLIIYHNSGDIFLDRSRPGLLPEKEEIEVETKEEYAFSENGAINAEVIDEFIEEYQNVIDSVNKIEEPFSPKPLADYTLGIPSSE